MNNKVQRERSAVQRLLDQQSEIQGEIARLQRQLNDHQTTYLQRTWLDGWNRNVPSTTPVSNIKINIDSKEKIFSLSSITSSAFEELKDNVDRHLTPFGEHRFESKKKSKKNKKRNAHQMRRPRSIRKKRRR